MGIHLGQSTDIWPLHTPTLGRQSEAETAVAQARTLNPKLTIKWLRKWLDVPEMYFEGLRKAGLPEE